MVVFERSFNRCWDGVFLGIRSFGDRRLDIF